MKYWIVPARITLLAVAALLVGCLHDNGNDTANNDATLPEDTVAVVNGNPITEADLDAQYQTMLSRGQSATREQALDELLELALLTQEAENQRMHEQPDIGAELNRQRMSTLANHLLRAELNAYEPDEDHMQAIYEARYGDESDRYEYHARHILLDERDTAEDMIALLGEGEDFAALAEAHSVGPSAPRGGDLDWFRRGDVVEAFGAAVAELEPGDYTTEPVETRFGWHVILLKDRRDVDPPELDDVRMEIENELLGEFIQEYINRLREDASIEIR